jgi:hypothetical protein
VVTQVKHTKFHITVLIFILFSCTTKNSNDKTTTVPSQTYPDTSVKSVQVLLPDTLNVNIKDTFTYSHRTFRIFKQTQSKDIKIQYWENNKWHNNVDIEVHDQLEATFDCNYDGYNDIYSQSQGWNYVNYYLPKQRLFSRQFKMPGDNEIIIDTLKRIYANFREPYHMCNYYNSQLIDYNKSVPTIHFLLSGETFYIDENCIIDSIKIMKLYRYDEQKDSLIFLESFKPKNAKKFEYENFWKKNYKRLMGYHQH